jgi:hypothetical protein
MSYYHPPSDEALEAFDAVCWALDKRADEDLYECARNTLLAFGPFGGWRSHLDAALAIVVTTPQSCHDAASIKACSRLRWPSSRPLRRIGTGS